jgi:hypothetical protein
VALVGHIANKMIAESSRFRMGRNIAVQGDGFLCGGRECHGHAHRNSASKPASRNGACVFGGREIVHLFGSDNENSRS